MSEETLSVGVAASAPADDLVAAMAAYEDEGYTPLEASALVGWCVDLNDRPACALVDVGAEREELLEAGFSAEATDKIVQRLQASAGAGSGKVGRPSYREPSYYDSEDTIKEAKESRLAAEAAKPKSWVARHSFFAGAAAVAVVVTTALVLAKRH